MPGKYGEKSGDLLIEVNLITDLETTLDGNDIKKVLKLAPWEAVLGTKVKVKGANEEISVYIPAGTNSGDIITIENKGYIDKNGNRGNLILEIQILIPNNCTDKEKELYIALKKNSNFNPRKKLT